MLKIGQLQPRSRDSLFSGCYTGGPLLPIPQGQQTRMQRRSQPDLDHFGAPAAALRKCFSVPAVHGPHWFGCQLITSLTPP